MARESISLSTRSSATPSLPTTSKPRSTSRSSGVPFTAQSTRKRTTLGERAEHDNVPSPSLPVVRSKEPKATSRTPSRPSTSKSRSSPVKRNPAHSGPPRSSVTEQGSQDTTLQLAIDDDETQLLNMRPPEMAAGLTSPVSSDMDDSWTESKPKRGQGRMGAGLVMTPSDSQEIPSDPPDYHDDILPTPRPFSRLPTPRSSQTKEEYHPSSTVSRVHPRPAPTPPRPPVRESSAVVAEHPQDPSPNPRRKKSPRVVDNPDATRSPSRLRSPFHPQDRLDVVNTPRASQPSNGISISETTTSKTARKSVSTAPPTPSLSQMIEYSAAASSAAIRVRTLPSTAPAAARRPRQSNVKRATAPKTVTSKPRSSRTSTPVSTGPSASRARSMTPSAIAALSGRKLGLLKREVKPTPGDDPLLLKGIDDDMMPRPPRQSSMQRSSVGLSKLSLVSDTIQPVRLGSASSSSSDRSVKETRGRARSDSAASARSLPSPFIKRHLSASKVPSPAPVGGAEYENHDLTLGPDADFGGYTRYDAPPAWMSDDSSDDEDATGVIGGGANDTFVDVIARKTETTSQPSSLRQVVSASDPLSPSPSRTSARSTPIAKVIELPIAPQSPPSRQGELSLPADTPQVKELARGTDLVLSSTINLCDETTVVTSLSKDSDEGADAGADVTAEGDTTQEGDSGDWDVSCDGPKPTFEDHDIDYGTESSIIETADIDFNRHKSPGQPSIRESTTSLMTGVAAPVLADHESESTVEDAQVGEAHVDCDIDDGSNNGTAEEEAASPTPSATALPDTTNEDILLLGSPESEQDLGEQTSAAAPESPSIGEQQQVSLVDQVDSEDDEGSDDLANQLEQGDTTVEADTADWAVSEDESSPVAPKRLTTLKPDQAEQVNEDHNDHGELAETNRPLSPSQVGTVEADAPTEGQSDSAEVEVQPEPRRSSRIVIKVVDRGTIKIEPEQSSVEKTHHISALEPEAPESSSSNGLALQLREVQVLTKPTVSPAVETSMVTLNPASDLAPSFAPSGSSVTASDSATALYPCLPTPVTATVNVSSRSLTGTTTQAPSRQPSVHRFANAASSTGVSAVEAMLHRRLSNSSSVSNTSRGPSHLSGQVPQRPQPESTSLVRTEVSVEHCTLVRPPLTSRQSLGEELASALATEPLDGDDSFRSVVEVSSLDPRAAARAAAILKMNHAYIEHGVLPCSSNSNPSVTPQSQFIPLPGSSVPSTSRSRPRTPHSRRKSRQVESAHFQSIESARKLNREELLYEAELEIVTSRRSRSRSRARSMGPSLGGYESDESELILPGGWKATPGKRKRHYRQSSAEPRQPSPSREPVVKKGKAPQCDKVIDRPWGVMEWKRLERIFRSEKEKWVAEREIKPLPSLGGGMSWARRAMGMSKGTKPVEWNADWVTNRFVESEGAQGLGGEWDRDMISLRVKALEKRADRRGQKSGKVISTEETQPAKKAKKYEEPKRDIARTATPARMTQEEDSSAVSIVPPGTIRRILGSMWLSKASDSGSAMKQPEQSMKETTSDTTDDIERPRENKLLSRMRQVQEPSPKASCTSKPAEKISQTSTPPGSPLTLPIAHSFYPAWSRPAPSSLDRPCLISTTRPTGPSSSLPTSLAPSASGSSSTGGEFSISTPFTKSLYPQLYPPLTQRSKAIRELFSDGKRSSGPSSRTPIAIPTRSGRQSPTVHDLVRSFEDEGVLGRSFGKKRDGQQGGGGDLRRVQSRGM